MRQPLRNFRAGLITLFLVGLLLPAATLAQKVGLVLSGGGAKGLAHVGVLKVLEANHIPIDYVVGTSMGAVVGSMYAAGYSPDEIERIVLTPAFQEWTTGKQSAENTYNFLSAGASPANVRLALSLDSALTLRGAGGVVNDVQLNYALARLLAPASAIAGYDFDKLFVPFRCLAAEVFTRREVVQRAGPVADAVRNSMAVPLAFRPIRQPNGEYLFDGGILNNFPTDVMRREFAPDVIIGVNVGDVVYDKYPAKRDDQLLGSTLLFLGLSTADSATVGPGGVFIQPDLQGFGAADFDKVQPLVAAGTAAALAKLPQLLAATARRADAEALATARLAFQERAPAPRFTSVDVQGLTPRQQEYIRRSFPRSGSTYSPDDIVEGYARLAADDFFSAIYPRIRYDSLAGGYAFTVDARQHNNLVAEAGALFSTRPVDYLYLGLEYRYLHRWLYTAGLSGNLGRFYSAIEGRFRIKIPGRLPYYIEPGLTLQSWNYQKTSGLLGRDVLSTQVQQGEARVGAQLGLSPKYHSLFLVDAAWVGLSNDFSNTPEINSNGQLDRLRFRGLTAALQFRRNSLNERQYATRGHRVEAGLRGITGQEVYTPGSTALAPAGRTADHAWLQFTATYERYFGAATSKSAWGCFGQLVLSNQPALANYRATLTVAPAFLPLPDSRTLFLTNYRAPSYAAAGLRYSHQVINNLAWRSEAFAHLRYRPWTEGPAQRAELETGLARPLLTASTGMVYKTPLGPVALQAIYYDDPALRWGLFGHIGYLLFRERALQ